ncbi:hypothetical protein PIN31115_04452 [Pandoraea iniqua]|uniref:Uncharacterized protein n=1 Tax=Pandoraea iniqua TaxID=2508288 RepID=A0A5E4YEG3_9BURK|nr:hypothetical protein [Pandoraea iniqua]VVE47176.1 hypothetical protein PIN31115_04452 [Pandoraea iniqua]
MSNTSKTHAEQGADDQLRNVLERLLESDEDITARAAVRHHPKINSASSMTRNDTRREMIAEYQARQAEFRRWRGKTVHRSNAATAKLLPEKDRRILELEAQVQLLTSSHLASIRSVGELGGFSRWAEFYAGYAAAQRVLGNDTFLATDKVRPLRADPDRT